MPPRQDVPDRAQLPRGHGVLPSVMLKRGRERQQSGRELRRSLDRDQVPGILDGYQPGIFKQLLVLALEILADRVLSFQVVAR